MKFRWLLISSALLLTSGMARADIIGGLVFCASSLDASGKVVTKCQNADMGGGLDAPGTWQQPEPGWIAGDGIIVLTATYGWNCGAGFNNASYAIGVACDNAQICNYPVDYRVLGDPAPGCSKNFEVEYSCPPDRFHDRRWATVSPEAGFGKVATLSCQQ